MPAHANLNCRIQLTFTATNPRGHSPDKSDRNKTGKNDQKNDGKILYFWGLNACSSFKVNLRASDFLFQSFSKMDAMAHSTDLESVAES